MEVNEMRCFEYKIKDEIGIHARPAGLLAKLVKETGSVVTIEKNGNTVDATKLFSVMGLGVKCGDTVKICVQDGDEEQTEKILREFLEKNL